MGAPICRRCKHFVSIHTLGTQKACTAPGCECKLKSKG